VSRFAKLLGAIALVALAVRWVYAVLARDYVVQGDALTYHLVGQGIADGRGFTEAFPPGGPTAEHPPAMFVLWGLVDKLGLNGYLSHRLVLGIVGTVTVVLIGLLARRIGGDRVGLAAAALAALYPMLFAADGALMSESVYGVFLVAALIAALRLHDRPSPGRAAALGALIALAALSRGEALALIALLAIPVAYASRASWRGRAALWGVSLAAFVAVLAPWTIFNFTRFEKPVLISTNSNGVFIGSNCEDTYYGDLVGAWRFQCYTPRLPGEDESEYFARQREIGLDYAREHAERWPVVAAARIGRMLDVYRVDQSVFFNAAEGRPARAMRPAIRFYWLVALLAIAGAVLLARRRSFGLVVLLAPVVMVFCVSIATYGSTRFRFAAEPSLVVLAAVSLVALAQRLLAARRPVPGSAEPPAPPPAPAASLPASPPRA
jgi:4-amino-4-deoxy-L-arabinose transferase-like glycosyltransferase